MDSRDPPGRFRTPQSRKTRCLKDYCLNQYSVQFQNFFCSFQFFVCWNWCLAFLALWLSGNYTITELRPLLFLLKLVITCVTLCVSFVWIVFLVKKRLDRFKRLDRLNDSDRFLKTIGIVLKTMGIILKMMGSFKR